MTDAFDVRSNETTVCRVEVGRGDRSFTYPTVAVEQLAETLTVEGLDPLTAEALISRALGTFGEDARHLPATFTDDPSGDSWTVEVLRGEYR